MTTTVQPSTALEALRALAARLQVSPATDEEVLSYMRRSFKMGRAVALAERDAIIVKLCEQLEIVVSDEDLQVAADEFRQKHKLITAAETQAWFSKMNVTADDWSEGLKLDLYTRKLEEHLFGEQVDNLYVNNRDNYKRAGFSQILVSDEAEAQRLATAIREENASFGALAIEHSKGSFSKANAGYVGIRFFGELEPEIAQAMSEAQEGEIVGPIKTKRGYHIIRIEKWFPSELTMAQRKRMLAAFLKLTVANIEMAASSDGSELLTDSESFMGELTDDELAQVAGGISPTISFAAAGITGGIASIIGSKTLVDRIQGQP